MHEAVAKMGVRQVRQPKEHQIHRREVGSRVVRTAQQSMHALRSRRHDALIRRVQPRVTQFVLPGSMLKHATAFGPQ
eukprot:1289581-Amphidinium_carterae.1